MITKYKANWLYEIKEVEIIRETEKMVYVKDPWSVKGEGREAKMSGDAAYFDTWDEAHAYIYDRALAKARSAQWALDQAMNRVENIKGMKAP